MIRSQTDRIVPAVMAGVLLLLLAVLPARAADPPAHACATAAGSLGPQHTDQVHLAFENMLPFTQAILERHKVKSRVSRDGKSVSVDVMLEQVRKMDVPRAEAGTITWLDPSATRLLEAPRSHIREVWRVDEATVMAADRAYEIDLDLDEQMQARPRIDPASVQSALPEYRLLRLYGDAYSGFAGMVLEAVRTRGDRRFVPHRIYAVAGSRVFYNTDLRTWASGLTMARAQFVSNAALEMVEDAAAYAADASRGGEVFVTGQSQGGLTSQGLGFLIQSLLDARRSARHLVHVISWGAIGARESVLALVEAERAGGGRGMPAAIERHWEALGTSTRALRIWNELSAPWAALPSGAVGDHVDRTAARMRVVGFFFEIDLFARAGTFLGTTYAFPTELVLPDDCEQLVAELVVGSTGGDFGVRLESHFLNGYERAVRRGAIGLARPALPHKWSWVTDMLPTFAAVGDAWLESLYLDRLGESPGSWRACGQASRFRTDANLRCEALSWPGCGPRDPRRFDQQEGDWGSWCLIVDR